MSIIAVDTETYDFDTSTGKYTPVLDARKFVLGCAIKDGNKPKFFNEREDMFKWIIKTMDDHIKWNKRAFFYAHNTEYDWYAIANDNLMIDDLKYICFNPFIAIYKKKGYLLDSMAFFKMSLKDVGQIINLPKLEMPGEADSTMQLQPYLERDTQIVYDSIQWLKNRINTMGFSPKKFLTAGQLAMSSFLTFSRRNNLTKSFMEFNPKRKIYQVVKAKYPDEARWAFRGGNNQAFKVGKFDEAVLLDINGLYAYAMTVMDFPNLRSEIKNDEPSVGMLTSYLEDEIGVARVTIQGPSIDLPYLPVKYQKFQVFPSGKLMRGTWTFLELKKALELGYKITQCEWAIRWKKLYTNPLKAFIEHIYELEKKEETKQGKSAIKLLRNNLYGKFSQNRKSKDYKMIERAKVGDLLSEGYVSEGTFDNKYIMSKVMSDYQPSYVNPIISAQITATARDILWDHLRKVPIDDLLYCDTDSVMFKGYHIDKFRVSKDLGDFKIVDMGNCKILGEKRYYIRTLSAGVSSVY